MKEDKKKVIKLDKAVQRQIELLSSIANSPAIKMLQNVRISEIPEWMRDLHEYIDRPSIFQLEPIDVFISPIENEILESNKRIEEKLNRLEQDIKRLIELHEKQDKTEDEMKEYKEIFEKYSDPDKSYE